MNANAPVISSKTTDIDPDLHRTEPLEKVVTIAGRTSVALLFILAGAAKILNPGPFLEHMRQFSVPTILFPAVIVLALGAGIAVLIGWRLRYAAGALGLFCVMTGVIFHHQLGISAERTSFFKDLAIAGGLFAMAASAAALARVKKRASA